MHYRKLSCLKKNWSRTPLSFSSLSVFACMHKLLACLHEKHVGAFYITFFPRVGTLIVVAIAW